MLAEMKKKNPIQYLEYRFEEIPQRSEGESQKDGEGKRKFKTTRGFM